LGSHSFLKLLKQQKPILLVLNQNPEGREPSSRNLLEVYDSLIFISVASKLSGTNSTILQEVKKLDLSGKKVSVIDSRLNSGAEGLLVKRASDLLDEGFGHDEIVEEIEKIIPKTKIYVCLDTIEYAVLGGRVSNTVGKIGMKVGLRPIMTLDEAGGGATFAMALSRKGITRKIMKLIQKTIDTKGISAYSIVHANNLELANEYKNRLTKMTGKEPEFITEISSIIAINSGPGAVAVSITEQ
jgi:uncharacterized protein